MFDPYGHSARARSRPQGATPRQAAASQNAGVPATAATRPWHRRPAWTRYARQLLRYYSRRGDFHLAIKPGQTSPLACVIPARKRVEVTTDFPAAEANGPLPTGGIRRERRLRGRPTDTWLRGFVAHEAGHIRFSDAKPAKSTLGWLWNALEDERMERLMAAAHRELRPVFEVMGDVMLSRSDEDLQRDHADRQQAEARADDGDEAEARDVLNACLLWRWLHDHAADVREKRLPLPEAEFQKVRSLVEEAWAAPDSDEVTRIASKILAVFDIPEDAPVPEGVPVFDLPGGVAADGRPADEDSAGDNSDDPSGEEDDGDEDDAENADDDAGGDIEEPEAPAHDPQNQPNQAGARLLDGQQQAVQTLADALRPEAPSPLRQPHRSRGRFEYRRWAAGMGRVFTRQPERPQPPAALTVLLDASGSMRLGGLFASAKRCVALLSGAAEVAGTAFRVIPFTTGPHRTLGVGGSSGSIAGGHEALRARIAGYRADERTTLAPALRRALEAPPGLRPGARHIAVLVSDGQLEGRDPARCREVFRRAQARTPRLVVLPLLLGGAVKRSDNSGVDAAAVYERIFGRYAPIENPADLAEVAGRWIRHATQ